MITLRAIIVGIVCSFLIAVGEPLSVLYAQASALCADYSTGGAVFLFFILVFIVNLFLKKLIPRFCLKPFELITVYIMMIVACAIPSWGFTLNLIGLLGGIFYYATPENRWEELIHVHLPPHLFPQDREAILHVYEGLPAGMGIPWSSWVGPLANWFVFILAFYFMSICLMVMLRKQWVEKERITFPLTELPLQMVREDVPLYKSKLMWLGFLVPLVIYSMRGFNIIFPHLPAVNLLTRVPIFRESFTISFNIFFEVIGLAFLVPISILLSVWFFALFFSVQAGFANMMGFSIGPVLPFSDPAPQVVAMQSLGALFFFSITCLWSARKHLREIYLKAVGKNPAGVREEEILSYRVSFWGFALCFLFVIFWINRTGLRLLPSVFFTAATVLVFLGVTRIITQTGLAYYRAPVMPAVSTVDLFGSSYLGSAGLAGLGLTFAWAADLRTMVMVSVANGLKMAGNHRINGTRLLVGILAAIVVALISSSWIILLLGYRYGGINLQSWQFSGLARFSMGWVRNLIHFPTEFGGAQFGFMLLGGGLMYLLILARNFLPWWPLSPVGMAIGLSLPVHATWFSVFLAWIVKVLILKYGGVRAYNSAKNFFFGMILGSFTTSGIWIMVGLFTGIPGLRFTLG